MPPSKKLSTYYVNEHVLLCVQLVSSSAATKIFTSSSINKNCLGHSQPFEGDDCVELTRASHRAARLGIIKVITSITESKHVVLTSMYIRRCHLNHQIFFSFGIVYEANKWIFEQQRLFINASRAVASLLPKMCDTALAPSASRARMRTMKSLHSVIFLYLAWAQHHHGQRSELRCYFRAVPHRTTYRTISSYLYPKMDWACRVRLNFSVFFGCFFLTRHDCYCCRKVMFFVCVFKLLFAAHIEKQKCVTMMPLCDNEDIIFHTGDA